MKQTGYGTKVFIAGSRHLLRLNHDVRRRLDNIVEKGFTVILGDANGADRAVQRYLSTKRYRDVLVFCMDSGCRNNVGGWPTRTIKAADPLRRDFAYYSTKDRAMSEAADYGLMLWDGRSRGTLTNIVHLVREGKPVVVYVAPERSFYTLRQSGQLAKMLNRLDPSALARINGELEALRTSSSSGRKVTTAPLF
jgi:hypothetical protein